MDPDVSTQFSGEAYKMDTFLDPMGVAASTARSLAAALMARSFRGLILAIHNTSVSAADKLETTYGDEDPIYLVNRDIAAVTERIMDDLDATSVAADSSFLEELHEVATFAADATHSFVGTHKVRRMAQQAQDLTRTTLQQAGDVAATLAETAGLGPDALAAAQENVRRRRRRRKTTRCGRCKRKFRSCCFRFRLWCRRNCDCCC